MTNDIWMPWNEIERQLTIELDCEFPRRYGLIVADYSFEQIAKPGTSIMDENYSLAYGLHRIAFAKSTPTGDIVDYVEFVGYLCDMPSDFARYYNLPDYVWCAANTRGIAKSRNVENRVVSFRLSSMTEGE